MAVETNIKLKTLSYVIVYVKDAQKSLPFYRDSLGLKVTVNDGGWVELATGATTLALHSDDNYKAAPEHAPIIVFEVDDIYASYDALKAKGIQCQGEPKIVCENAAGKVGKSVDFTDVDGNRLSIFGYCQE